MDDLIDIVDEHGELIGKTASKSEIHQKGWYHNTAHLWLYTSQGEILLSQRAASKKIYPLLWDVSVAGHVDAGESIIEALIRETQEEINLTISENELQKVGVFKCFQTYAHGITDNEFHHAFISELNVDINDLSPQPYEVEAFKLVGFESFSDLLQNSSNNSHFVESNRSYYIFILDCIRNAIKN